MNRQLATIVAALTLLVSAGGCSGMKNFLFGRGAACSTCATAPSYGPVAHEPVCGYEPTCGHEPVCGHEPALIRPFSGFRGCGLLNGQPTCGGTPGCGCGSTQSYMPSGVDSYYGEVHDPYAYGGEVVGSQVMGDVYNGYPAPGSVVSEGIVPGSSYVVPGDNFNARGAQPAPAVPQAMPQQ